MSRQKYKESFVSLTATTDATLTGTVNINTTGSGTTTFGSASSNTASAGDLFINSGKKIKIYDLSGSYTTILGTGTQASNLTFTLPNAAAVRNNQTLVANTSGVASWTDSALNGGNTLGTALSLGTNDAFGLNLKTNGTNILNLDISGNITGTGTTWTQNNVQLFFSVVSDPAVSYSTPNVASFTVPSGYTQMRVQLWGAGAGAGGGSGAYAEVTMTVTTGQIYWLVVGGAGIYSNTVTNAVGGSAGGGNASGQGGTAKGTASTSVSGGGQYSALIRQSGSNYILIAAAGGGGGGNGPGATGGGGGRAAPASFNNPQPGAGGVGGTGGSGTGSNYAVNATTTGHTSLVLGGQGASNLVLSNIGAGGGGYGGGAAGIGGGSGGGCFVQAVSTVIASSTIISSTFTLGNNGGSFGIAPPNAVILDNYISPYGAGGGNTASGNDGLAAVTFSQRYVQSSGNVKTTGLMQMIRADSTQTVSVKASDTSTSWTLTLPTNTGSANQLLLTDGAGVASWSAVPQSISSISAAGVSQGTATAITTNHVKVTAGTGGVLLPLSTTFKKVTIKNTSGVAITVYPQGAGTIDAISNTTLADATSVDLISTGSDIWVSF